MLFSIKTNQFLGLLTLAYWGPTVVILSLFKVALEAKEMLHASLLVLSTHLHFNLGITLTKYRNVNLDSSVWDTLAEDESAIL